MNNNSKLCRRIKAQVQALGMLMGEAGLEMEEGLQVKDRQGKWQTVTLRELPAALSSLDVMELRKLSGTMDGLLSALGAP